MKTKLKSQHMPGPWERSPQSSGLYIRAQDGRNIAGVFADSETEDKTRRISYPKAEANARLIAAATDLLAALKVVRDSVTHDGERGHYDLTPAEASQMFAAIAKAEPKEAKP